MSHRAGEAGGTPGLSRRKSRPVAEPEAYLFRTLTNLVDAEIARYRRIVPLTDELLQEVAGRAAPSIEHEIDRETDWKYILESRDQTVRMVYERLRQGRTVREIALEMASSPILWYGGSIVP